jgi:hypothetical protein
MTVGGKRSIQQLVLGCCDDANPIGKSIPCRSVVGRRANEGIAIAQMFSPCRGAANKEVVLHNVVHYVMQSSHDKERTVGAL